MRIDAYRRLGANVGVPAYVTSANKRYKKPLVYTENRLYKCSIYSITRRDWFLIRPVGALKMLTSILVALRISETLSIRVILLKCLFLVIEKKKLVCGFRFRIKLKTVITTVTLAATH